MKYAIQLKSGYVLRALLALGLLLLGPGGAVVADLNDGLAAHYPFNGNADDESGNGHHGTVIGATLSQDRFGNAGSAFGFDGQNDYILIGQEPNFPSWGSNAVSLWFLNNGGGVWAGYGQKLMNKGTFFSDFYAGVYPDGATQYCTSMPWTCIHYSEHDYRDGQWHHLVMIRSGASGEMWIDGELVGTSNLMSSSNTGIDLTVGYSLHADFFQRHYWSGQIDDIRIYDRALSESEIQLLLNGVNEVAVDIKPGSCPNSFNRKSQGVLPVSIVSSDGFDALSIDISTILLSRADGVGGSVAPNEGPPGPHSVFADTATPFDGEPCDCHDLEGDLLPDLSMKFITAAVVEQLQLDDLAAGIPVELLVSGVLLDGTPFAGRDCLALVPGGGGFGIQSIAGEGNMPGGGRIDLNDQNEGPQAETTDGQVIAPEEEDDQTGRLRRVPRRGASRRGR